MYRCIICGAIAALLVMQPAFGQPEAAARKDLLLAVSQGQIPDDTGSDGQTKMTIVDYPPLNGKALKVDFAPGDSFGVRQSRIKNWKPFIALEFDAFNPEKGEVGIQFNVKHRRTTSYQTRVEHSLKLKPGKNTVRVGLDELVNVNSSTPDLSEVSRWYINCVDGKTPTLYFGDIYLVGGETAPASPTAPPVVGLGGPYRITGTIGDMKVDLILQPLTGTAQSGPGKTVTTDPGRLARIRAAKMPAITRPVLFNTPEADAILSALEVFPPDNPWNQIVEDWPLHPNSRNIIASIGADKPFRYNPDMGFVLVPPGQKRVNLAKVAYPDESDKGPFPIPDNMPIEGWPVQAHEAKYKDWTLDDFQRNKGNYDEDRHGLVVDPVNRMLYEFYQAQKTDKGWQASQASVFDLKTNKLRPDGWTSADAAGLPIFPAVVRYDELKRGLVEHAVRVSVVKTRRAYVAPATHYASPHTDQNYPRMGERIRLRRDFDVSGFSPEVQAILKGLKKYGMFVADNGIDWAISVAPDERIPVMHEELRKIKGSDFEVVVAPQ